MARNNYTDAQKAEYWKQRALGGQSSNYGNRKNDGYSRNKSTSKKSGAKFTQYQNADGVQRFLTTGWRLNRSKELIAIKAVTTDKSEESEKGWFGSVAVTFTNTITGESNFHWGTMERKTGKVVVDKLAVVINPRAKNGGYAGTYIKK